MPSVIKIEVFFAFCQKKLKYFPHIDEKKWISFSHFVKKKETHFVFCQKVKQFLPTVKKIETSFAFCRKK